MLGYSFTHSDVVGETDKRIPPQLDITAPEWPVEVEVDHRRNVLYVHAEGVTILRICRAAKFNVVQHSGMLPSD